MKSAKLAKGPRALSQQRIQPMALQSLDISQPDADGAVLNGAIGGTSVDIGRQHGDPLPHGVINQGARRSEAHQLVIQNGGVEGRRMMIFEPG